MLGGVGVCDEVADPAGDPVRDARRTPGGAPPVVAEPGQPKLLLKTVKASRNVTPMVRKRALKNQRVTVGLTLP